MSYPISQPYSVFADIDGQPLENGYIYIGTANLDPQTNPITVYWDAAGTITASQPIRTLSGYPVWNGTAANIYVSASDCSIKILNKNGTLVTSKPTSRDQEFANNMIFVQSGTGAVARTVQSKLRDVVSVKDFGAVGDGVTDDTAAIQAALNSGAKEIVFPAGSTYLTDGGLVSNTAGQVFRAYGATIKLKANATTKGMLRLNGAGSAVYGGTWDGNKANGNGGPTSGSTLPIEVYSSWNIGVFANRCTIKDCYSINTYGMFCTGGSVSDTLFQDNTVRNTVGYGFFLSSAVDAYRNRAIGNNIDMSESVVWGQGILFTRTGTVRQYDWELSNNTVIGSQDPAIADLAINLGVRGDKGIVSNNITRYGAMGFSEGGTETVITGNSFLDLVGTTRYGIEVSGANTTVTGNTISNAQDGIIVSGNINYDDLCITGNRIQATSIGIQLQIAAGYTGTNITISGNNIVTGSVGINTKRTVSNLTIVGNTIIGPSNTFASGKGIFLDTPTSDAYVFISGNTIVNVQRPYSVYSAAATTFNYLFAVGNNLSLAGNNTNSSIWTTEGAAVIGTAVVSANNINPTTVGAEYSMINQASFILNRYGTGSPEGVITAGIGSLYINKSGGTGTTLYVKESGTGNTGWVGK